MDPAPAPDSSADDLSEELAERLAPVFEGQVPDSAAWLEEQPAALRPRLAAALRDWRRLEEELGGPVPVALKILTADQSLQPQRLARFRREAEAGARLRHPGSVPVHAFGEAEAIYREALAGFEALGLADHPRFGMVASALAELLRRSRRLDEAEEMFLTARESCRRNLGPDNPMTLKLEGNLGTLYLDQGRVDEAEEIFRQALRMSGRADEGVKLIEQAVADLRRLCGIEDIETQGGILTLAQVRLEAGRWEEAEELAQEVYDVQLRLLGEDANWTTQTAAYLDWIRRTRAEREAAGG